MSLKEGLRLEDTGGELGAEIQQQSCKVKKKKIGYLELGRTHKDYQIQLLTSHRTT